MLYFYLHIRHLFLFLCLFSLVGNESLSSLARKFYLESLNPLSAPIPYRHLITLAWFSVFFVLFWTLSIDSEGSTRKLKNVFPSPIVLFPSWTPWISSTQQLLQISVSFTNTLCFCQQLGYKGIRSGEGLLFSGCRCGMVFTSRLWFLNTFAKSDTSHFHFSACWKGCR